jgi:hypothetical protein
MYAMQRADRPLRSGRDRGARAGPFGLAVLPTVTMAVMAGLAGCGATGGEAGAADPVVEPGTEPRAEVPRPASCPERAAAPEPLPRIEPKHRELDYWLKRIAETQGELDEPLLTPSEVADHERALRQTHEDGEPLGQMDLLGPVDRERLERSVRERTRYMVARAKEGTYLNASGERLEDGERHAMAAPEELPPPRPSLRVALGNVALHCGPRVEGLYTKSLDLDFDRNRCSMVRFGEPLQLLGTWPGGMLLARTRYALGFVAGDAPLSPPLEGPHRDAFVRGPGVVADRALTLTTPAVEQTVPAGARLPLAPNDPAQVLLPTAAGIVPVPRPDDAMPTKRPLTRRAVFEEAFSLLGAPYGWGGKDGGRDCSRFLLDVFGRFGLGLPRHSARQALAGTFALDVEDVESERTKQRLIDAAAEKGIVLLHFPGHIMLYLGKTEEGRPMAIHSFAEYVEPCDEGEGPDGRPLETLYKVGDVSVSDLELGRGGSRTAFIERITRIVVVGDAPGIELQGVAEPRPAAPVEVPEAGCDDSLDVAIFQSPKDPHAAAPARIIVTSAHDPRPARLTLFDPEGAAHEPEERMLGGPPFTFWAELERPAPGRWTAVLGDGSRIEACERFRVGHGPRPAPTRTVEPAPAWEPRWSWERDTENLYAAFVEQLFTDPADEDVTWDGLQQLLADPERNLLHDHLGLDEDDRLALEPDCADLPYFLRAYFAWKIELPFAFRRCTRGRQGVPPACGEELYTNLEPVEATDPVRAFDRFRRLLASGVHSGSARTAPDADRTDLYPVPLNRQALRPGTVFADPYGHLLVVAAFRPQTEDDYGVLVGADAQPDATVGRRRFWKGSFLFTPNTTNAGAGFKRFRPVVYDKREEAISVLDNEALKTTDAHVPWSEDQYEGTTQDFYDRMAALINPRPLDPVAVQVSLVDAFEEAVARRVDSVENGVEFMRERSWQPIEMPTGYDIFETSGAWENFSTPARDMRLLISRDAVVDFPSAVARHPERFGLTAAEVDLTVRKLRERLQQELEARSFEYERSDGSTWALTLADVAEREDRFEMAYHPNDCTEIRWAATPGSEERSTCTHHAPDGHRARMERYREWFEDRQRPPR